MTVQELLALDTRGAIKRAGAYLDGAGAEVRGALVAAARARGAEVPDSWQDLDGKRLLKACLARAEGAQVRTTPIARDEAFTCSTCAREVPCGGKRPRDHCPWCLHSRHVDVVPGDRASTCGGDLVPQAAERSPQGKGWMIVYRCVACGALRRNRVLDDVEPPDDAAAVRALVVRVSGLG
jgi:hypothetical protein